MDYVMRQVVVFALLVILEVIAKLQFAMVLQQQNPIVVVEEANVANQILAIVMITIMELLARFRRAFTFLPIIHLAAMGTESASTLTCVNAIMDGRVNIANSLIVDVDLMAIALKIRKTRAIVHAHVTMAGQDLNVSMLFVMVQPTRIHLNAVVEKETAISLTSVIAIRNGMAINARCQLHNRHLVVMDTMQIPHKCAMDTVSVQLKTHVSVDMVMVASTANAQVTYAK